MSIRIHLGDCIEVMRSLPECSIDAVVTDPPYGLGFMGHEWDQPGRPSVGGRKQPGPVVGSGHKRERDALRKGVKFGGPTGVDNTTHTARGGAMHAGRYNLSLESNRGFQQWCEEWATETLRILKPGGHLLVFGGTRTYHRLAAGIEDAGFEIRDCLAWLFGSGFPKSLNLEGEYAGWGTALKPAHEPIVMARKSLAGSVLATVSEFGTGALNINGCRLDPASDGGSTGRWPSNVLLDEVAAEQLDEQSGRLTSGANPTRRGVDKGRGVYGDFKGQDSAVAHRGVDAGGASRFFYVAKASRAERNAGLDGFDKKEIRWSSGDQSPGTFQSEGTDRFQRNHHPTVKPIALMRHLVRLVTPMGGGVLDPFMGSGTTGIACYLEGFDFVGIERESDYVKIAEARIAHFKKYPPQTDHTGIVKAPQPAAGQDSLFGT